MASPLLTPRRSLLIIALLLFVNCMLPSQYGTKLGYVPRSIITAAAGPLAIPLKSLSDAVRGGAVEHPDFGTEEDVLVELEHRMQQVVALEEALREAQDMIVMLSQSRELLSLEGYQLLPARVAGYSSGRISPVITIDKGTTKGVREGAPVLYGISLVGRVTAAYPFTADVELITAKGTELQVRILPPTTGQAPRELIEMIKLADGRKWFEVLVEKDEPVEVGDLASLVDDRWPPEARGYFVGAVKRILDDPSDPLRFKRLFIEPLPPLESLSRVTVLAPVE